MENKNYKVKRDNIYVGAVVKSNKIFRVTSNNNLFNEKIGQLVSLGAYWNYRSMLFIPNEKKLANDLLFNSPCYPIINFTDDEFCLSLEEDSIIIKKACNLSQLLKYFGYGEELTYEDILKIRKTFFTGKFAKENCRLFGWEEKRPEELVYYNDGVVVTDPRELKKLIEKEKEARRNGKRQFFEMTDSILPKEYWDILDSLGDASLMESLCSYGVKRNAFAPHKEEGPIKKLTRL